MLLYVSLHRSTHVWFLPCAHTYGVENSNSAANTGCMKLPEPAELLMFEATARKRLFNFFSNQWRLWKRCPVCSDVVVTTVGS